MSIEQVGPGGVSNSYGARTTSPKEVYDNTKQYEDVSIPKGTIPLTATISDGGVRFSDTHGVASGIEYLRPAQQLPASVISGASYAGWAKIAGGGNSAISASPVDGFAARITTNNVSTGYVVAKKEVPSFVLGSAETISFAVNVLHANNTRNIKLTLLADAAGTIKASVQAFQFWVPGVNIVSFKLSDATFAGGATVDTEFKYIQFDVIGPSFATQIAIDVGPVWLGGAARVPLVCVTFDMGYDKVYDWALPAMQAHGITGNVYALPINNGSGGVITDQKYRELYAAGWDIGLYMSVTASGLTGAANYHSPLGVTTAQTVAAAANFNIDGAFASGGVAVIDTPRIVTVSIASGNEGTNSFTITGTNGDGAAITEQITGPSSSAAKAYTSQLFKTVSSVVAQNLTSVQVSIGTAYTQDEILARFSASRAWQEANGFTRGASHCAYPLGDYNGETPKWMARAGFKTGRTVSSNATLGRNQTRFPLNNNHFMQTALNIGDPGSTTALKTAVSAAAARGLDIFVMGHLGGGTAPDQAELNSAIGWIASLHRTGTIRVVSFSEYEALRGL